MADNDLISRAAAIFVSDSADYRGLTVEEVTKVTDVVSAGLRDLPAVDAVPIVHAQWIEEPDRYHHWHCSACGFVEGIVSQFYHYCPNCGAKIGGEINES